MLPGSYVKLSREMSLQKWLGATSGCVEQSTCAPVTGRQSQTTFKTPHENIRSVQRERKDKEIRESRGRATIRS